MADDQVSDTTAVYDQIAQSYAHAVQEFAPETERKRFVSLLANGGSVLDLGCAAGRDSIWFASRGLKPTGVDLSENLLAIARERAPDIDFLRQDIRKLDFPDDSFDGIWACAVLLHLSRSEALSVMKRCHFMLKPDGILTVMVKKGRGEADVAETLSSGVSRHFTYFETDELKTMMHRAGFSVTDLYTWKEKDRQEHGRDVEWISCFAAK